MSSLTESEYTRRRQNLVDALAVAAERLNTARLTPIINAAGRQCELLEQLISDLDKEWQGQSK